jgi:hypothetical protein
MTGPKCSRGLINLLTMASFNMVTDIALIILPFPMLRHIRLNLLKYVLSMIKWHRSLSLLTSDLTGRFSSSSSLGLE